MGLGVGVGLGLGGGRARGGAAAATSHRAEMELMLEMRCARKAFAVSFDSSALHKLVVSTCGLGTHRRYTLARHCTAACPAG